jgi:hypothetical protein
MIRAVLILALVGLSQAQVDLTLQPGTSGEDVVDAVDAKIQAALIFPEDHRFMVRVAYMESQFGIKADTYRPQFFGGIWQIDAAEFVRTQDPAHAAIFQKIQAEFSIDWPSITWQDLEKPLYSGLAFRILVETFGAPVPDTIALQADYWKQYYNTDPTPSAAQFVTDIQTLESETTCFGRMNLEIVLDGSGSIGQQDYDKAKEFVAELVSTFSLASTRIGLTVYSSSTTEVFPLNNVLTSAEMDARIRSAPYPGMSTRTDLGIDDAVVQLQNSNLLGTTAPKIILVLTDGHSDDNSLTVASAANAETAGIATFAVGIGSNVDINELIAIAGNNPARVLSAGDFDSLIELIFTINSQTCKVPQTPSFGQVVKDAVAVKEKRFYKYAIPSTGLTVTLQDTTGRSRGFYSYNFPTPSSAVNDGIVDGRTFIPPNPQPNARNSGGVFVAVQGIQINTNYTINAVQGNTVATATSEFIRNGPVLPMRPCGGYTANECQTACAARQRKWAHGTCVAYVCSCH